MMSRCSFGVLALSVALISCSSERETLPPLGYHLVTIDTDALVPGIAGEGEERPALFDRLEVSVLFDGETEPRPESVRIFDVTADAFDGEEGKGASFTISREPASVEDIGGGTIAFPGVEDGEDPGASGSRPRVRARLYRGASVYEGRVQEETAIDVWARLPPTPETGAVETTIYLLTDDVGFSRGSAIEPMDPADAPEARVRSGRPDATLVGTWEGAVAVDCSADQLDGRICVPGGAYWMGNPIVKGDDFVESDRQRLVVLRPFFLDTREVTVAELREWMASKPDVPIEVTEHIPDPSLDEYFCTFTSQPGDNEDRPANCVSWATAERYCNDHGGALPTESQFEYVSGALRSALYVWGTDEAAICGAAVWGRGGRNGTAIAEVGSSRCLPTASTIDGPLPLSDVTMSTTRITDRIELRSPRGRLRGLVFDLAGNLQEWQSDYYSGQGSPCWKRPESNIFYDPVCTDVGVEGERSVRGGSWLQDRAFLRAAYRTRRSAADALSYDVGFRCAQADEPVAE